MVEDAEETALVERNVGLGVEVFCAFGASVECSSSLNSISKNNFNSFMERLLINEYWGDIKLKIHSEII